MSYELEYEKSYDGHTVTAKPIAGHPNLPTLRVEATPDQVDSVVFFHRTRTLDPQKPGITALVFGLPGKVQIVHHDCEVVQIGSAEAALAHERAGEQNMLISAYTRQERTPAHHAVAELPQAD